MLLRDGFSSVSFFLLDMARCRDAFLFALELNLTPSLYQSSLLCLDSKFLKEKKEKLLNLSQIMSACLFCFVGFNFRYELVSILLSRLFLEIRFAV